MRMILVTAFFVLMMMVPFSVSADSEEDPRWSIALKGGQGEMQTENWETVYDENIEFGGIEFGWKFSQQLGINIGASYSRSTGKAKTESGRISIDDVKTKLVPVEISCVYRLVFANDQIFLPYVAGGYTHTFYKTQLNADERTGDQSGYHLKGGFQLLLDLLEPSSADTMETRWGVINTYLFLEYYFSEVDDFGSESTDLGSEGIVGGLIFEF